MSMSQRSNKRKRHTSDRGASLSKDAATGSKFGGIAVNVLPSDARAPQAIVASAPGLDISHKLHFSLSKRHKKNAKKGSRTASTPNLTNGQECILSTNHSTLEYTGHEDRTASDENKLQSYLGVYDPSTGELQVMEACKMVLRVSTREDTDEGIDKLKTPRQTNAMLRRELGLEFGTKKAKKVIEANTQNTLASPQSPIAAGPATDYDNDNDSNSNASQTQTEPPPSTQRSLRRTDPLAAVILESMDKKDAHMPSREDMQTASDAAKPRPRANLEAQAPAKVYSIDSLIAEEELHAMMVKDWLDAIRNGQEVMQSSKFVARRLAHVAQKNDLQSLRLLKYISTLRDFYAALKPLRGGGRKLPMREQLKNKTGVNNYVLDCIRGRYTNGSEMTKWHVDNLMTHIFAMTLLVDMYETDTSDIREDFQLDTKQTHQYFRELGCRVKPPTESDRSKLNIKTAESPMHHIARLKLPLTFPKTRVMPMNKRR